MKIHLNTDNHISASEGLSERADRVVGGALERFADRLTRVEAHISDVNSHKTGDGVDKRCVLEARVAGHQPVAVTEDAETVEQALSGAAQKLKRALDSMFGKLDRRPEKAPVLPEAAMPPED
ncbi:HPF/RaiA family ribosome-associated protein [Alkalisalibacterium limincola]|uniref:HPF/RaiA family ribosome-associated protein n=1 Tax=Alkalisalibacterium limincola TaxID=2699169 RepID=A0A5C8KX28_9GAMM|nr:HPF/RaiA family ribosome-associated protein [Alkalisalibacterium limincola]TXK64919.1 HPF/RaiA family ribosome-associated protein [Alkalisalibacterium limincola]